MEKSDKLTPLGSKVASAKRMAADIIARMIENTFSSWFLSIQRQMNSANSEEEERSRNRKIVEIILVIIVF